MITTLLLFALALAGAPDNTPDWALANTLLAEHERNAALSADCAFSFKEYRNQIFFDRGIETAAQVNAVVHVARNGENLLVKRNETTNVRRKDGSLYVSRFEVVKNGEYIAYLTHPGAYLELFYHDRPGPSFDPDRGPQSIPGALGVGPHKCGFGDGHSPLAGILWAAREASSELSCKPVQEGSSLYALEINRPSGVFSRIMIDASKGALIVSSVKTLEGRKLSELEVVPAQYGDCWFPKTWKRTTYDKTGEVSIFSSSELSTFSNDASRIEFTFLDLLPSEEIPVVVYDEVGQRSLMYTVHGVLVTKEMAAVMRGGQSSVHQPGR